MLTKLRNFHCIVLGITKSLWMKSLYSNFGRPTSLQYGRCSKSTPSASLEDTQNLATCNTFQVPRTPEKESGCLDKIQLHNKQASLASSSAKKGVTIAHRSQIWRWSLHNSLWWNGSSARFSLWTKILKFHHRLHFLFIFESLL